MTTGHKLRKKGKERNFRNADDRTHSQKRTEKKGTSEKQITGGLKLRHMGKNEPQLTAKKTTGLNIRNESNLTEYLCYLYK
jgi:hypothetical protein